jgi:aminopeptidase N
MRIDVTILVLAITCSLFVACHGRAVADEPEAEATPPDRSLLWLSEEAIGHVLSPDMRTYADRHRLEHGYDVDDYHLDIAIDLDLEVIDATAVMSVTVTEAGRTQFPVDLDQALSVTRVTVNGIDRAFLQTPDQVLIDLPTAPPTGAELVFLLEYQGTPPEVGNKSMRFRSHLGVPLVYTLSTPYSNSSSTVIPISHYWRACKDVPDDKSTFSAAITVPDDMLACSNGLLISNVDNGNGTRTCTWQHDYPVAPYLVALGATNYVTIDETYSGPGGTAAVQHFVWPEDLADALESFNITVPAMEFFAGVYGEYPFIGEKYGMFETTSGPAVEEQTVVAYPNGLVNGGHNYDWILVHELAHMWWGDCVTCESWEHVWLNEGFASYSEALWWEHLYGASGLRSYMIAMDQGPYSGTIYDPPYVWHSIVYDKGGWVLHMLRHILGEAAFFQFVTDYRAAHEYGNAATDDLVAVAETVYGGDLDWFFEPWLYHTGRPTYEYWWHHTAGPGPDRSTVHLAIEQTQSTSYPTYTMPIDVVVLTSTGTERHVVWDSLRVQTFAIEVDGEPIAVSPDPDRWVLASFQQVTVGAEPAAPAPAERMTLAQNHPNPFNPATEIHFTLARPGVIALRVFDVHGRLVRTLARGMRPAGEYAVRWDGDNEQGGAVASGTYFYRLVGPGGVEERRMVLAR